MQRRTDKTQSNYNVVKDESDGTPSIREYLPDPNDPFWKERRRPFVDDSADRYQDWRHNC